MRISWPASIHLSFSTQDSQENIILWILPGVQLHARKGKITVLITVIPQYLQGIGSRTCLGSKIHGHYSPVVSPPFLQMQKPWIWRADHETLYPWNLVFMVGPGMNLLYHPWYQGMTSQRKSNREKNSLSQFPWLSFASGTYLWITCFPIFLFLDFI